MQDLISRQAAIDAMAELQGRASTKAELKGISKAWKRIKQLPSAQPEQRWIPVRERLPEGQTEVIVSCMDNSGDTEFLYTSSGWMTTDREYWIVDNEINSFVIAWMPMPEPWRGKGEK